MNNNDQNDKYQRLIIFRITLACQQRQGFNGLMDFAE